MAECNVCKDWTLLLLRIVIGLIFIWHGVPKIFAPDGAMAFFASLGFPAFIAPIVGVVEVAAGLLLILGLWHKYAAYALAVIIAVAILRVHLFAIFNSGITASFERDLLIFVGALVLASLGPGRWSLGKCDCEQRPAKRMQTAVVQSKTTPKKATRKTTKATKKRK